MFCKFTNGKVFRSVWKQGNAEEFKMNEGGKTIKKYLREKVYFPKEHRFIVLQSSNMASAKTL